AAAVIVMALAREKQSLEARYGELVARIEHPYAGMYVPVVRAQSVRGDSLVIGITGTGERQVLFGFSTTCGYCDASLASWETIAAHLADESGARVFGVSRDSPEATRAYVEDQGLSFPVVSFSEPRIRALYRLQAVPQTLILNRDGHVIYVRLGAVESEAAVDSVVVAARAGSNSRTRDSASEKRGASAP
ncbi:MAG: TlpA disulfide reductase family protein, partial [Gemmatimonadales bacterium]